MFDNFSGQMKICILFILKLKCFETNTETVYYHRGETKIASSDIVNKAAVVEKIINKVIFTKLSLNQGHLFSVSSMTNITKKSPLTGGNEASRECIAGGSVP